MCLLSLGLIQPTIMAMLQENRLKFDANAVLIKLMVESCQTSGIFLPLITFIFMVFLPPIRRAQSVAFDDLTKNQTLLIEIWLFLSTKKVSLALTYAQFINNFDPFLHVRKHTLV